MGSSQSSAAIAGPGSGSDPRSTKPKPRVVDVDVEPIEDSGSIWSRSPQTPQKIQSDRPVRLRPNDQQALSPVMKNRNSCKMVRPEKTLNEHLKNCKPPCKHCGVLVAKGRMKEHLRSSCKKCNHCNKRFSELGKHKKQRLKWPVTCWCCGVKIPGDQHDSHEAICKSKKRNRICTFCGKHVTDIKAHLKTCPKAPTVSCKWCGERAPKSTLFEEHLKYHCPVPVADRMGSSRREGGSVNAY